MDTMTLTEVKLNLERIIEKVNRDRKVVLIDGGNDSKSAYLIGKREYEAQQETMVLLLNGQLQDALTREHDGAIDIEAMIADIAAETENR